MGVSIAKERVIIHLLGKTSIKDECWVWKGGIKSNGYGTCSLKGIDTNAHRAFYKLLVGPIPDGLTIDHLCRNRACVNPFHLEVVSMAENLRRGMSPSAIIHRNNRCKHGHEFTPENSVYYGGQRKCRICSRESCRKLYRKHRDKRTAYARKRYAALRSRSGAE